MKPILLGVNVDHVATLRQNRGTPYPDPVEAALIAEMAGADGITIHPREDRRHIQDHDVFRLKEELTTRMNLEMAATEDMLQFALDVEPEHCCIVPEKREELTTEGGLNVCSNTKILSKVCLQLAGSGSQVSLFIDPDKDQIKASRDVGAQAIEIHTGHYAEAGEADQDILLKEIQEAALFAQELGLVVNAGHGLHLGNTVAIAHIPCMNELNIGHSIVARSVFVGFYEAVKEMRVLIDESRASLN